MIPKLNVATALAIYDGAELAGFIVRHDGAYFSYDSTHTLIGEYASQGEASRSIPITSSPQRGAHRRTRSRNSIRR
jgi:hypothetical protein